MKIIGKATISPVFFYSGKMIGYYLWISFLLSIFGIRIVEPIVFLYSEYISLVMACVAVVFIILSSIYLGKSIRLGLPDEPTQLKLNGIYRFSRNPMYVGFDLLTVASLVGNFHLLYLFMGIYSLIIYHFIILGEEEFLRDSFGEEYKKYEKNVRRYI